MSTGETTNSNAEPRAFRVGDHVSWNYQGGRARGRIRRIHVRNFVIAGYTRHASKVEPQFEIHSDTTDHIAYHKGSALRRLRSTAP